MRALRIIGLVVAWYLTSSTAVLLLKAVFQGRFATPFAFPLTVTVTSNLVSAGWAALASPACSRTVSVATRNYAMVIGAMTAGEIGLSNAALNMLTVSLAMMLRGAAPLLVMAWGIALRVYRPSWSTAVVVALLCGGLMLAVDGQKDGQSSRQALRIGLAMECAAGVLSGLRWVVTQLFVKGSDRPPPIFTDLLGGAPERELDAMEVIRLTAPSTAVAMAPVMLLLEGRRLLQWIFSASWIDLFKVLGAALEIGCCVFALLWAQYELVRCTSSLTVSIAFVAKEVFVIAAGVVLFGDRLTWRGVAGFTLVQVGIAAYSMLKENTIHESLPKTAPENDPTSLEERCLSSLTTTTE